MRDEDIDRLIRESIADLDGLPPQAPHVDLEMAFQKIQGQLHGGSSTTSKKNFPGIFDLAAAMVALLFTLGYGINYLLDTGNLPLVEKPGSEAVVTLPSQAVHTASLSVAPQSFTEPTPLAVSVHQPEEQMAIASAPMQLPAMERVQPEGAPVLQPVKKTKGQAETSAGKVSFAVEHSLVQAFKSAQQVQGADFEAHAATHRLSLQMPLGLAYAGGHGAATLGTRLQWATGQPGKRTETTVHVGASLYAWATALEGEGQPAVSPQVFVEVSTGKIARQKGKWVSGHEVGMGYRVAGQRDFMGTQLIKVNYTLHVKDRIQVSPEVMVSELSLQSGAVYPGIRVTVI